MVKALITAGIIIVPILLMAIGLKLAGRKVEWPPVILAIAATSVYFLLLRGGNYIPVPAFIENLELTWVNKTLTIAGTLAMLALLPRVNFKAAGLTWTQNKGSLGPVAVAGGITLVFALGSSIYFAPSPNTAIENLLFQATMPGVDEEIFFRGLLLLLVHQAFGKTFKLWGADTGWGIVPVVAIFGLAHGFTYEDGALVGINFGAIIFTAYIGFILTWMRERTGSLLVPILYHNIFNVTMAFV